jgi:glycosyl transferase family 87
MSRTGLRRIGAAAVLLALLSWNAWIAHTMVTRLHMGDFRILYLSARAQLEGRDMYDLPSGLRTHLGQPLRSTLVNLNPPHFQLLVLPLALLPPGAALALWAGVSLLCLVVSIRVVARELELKPGAWGCWRAAVWLLAFAGTGAVVGTAEVAFLFMLPLTLGWAAARRGGWRRAGVYLGLAMGLKLFLLIFVPYLLLRRRFGAAVVSGATAAAWFLGGLLIVGPSTYWSWLSQISSVSWAWRGPNASVLGILTRSLDENPYYTPLTVAPEVILPLWLPSVAIIGFCSLALVMVDRAAAAVDRAFALLLSAALLISPLGWIYYLWLAAGPGAALALRWRREKTRDQSDPGAGAARWRLRLLMLAVPGLVWPYFATFIFQPHAWATPLLASAYFWSIATLWCALVLDWLAAPSQSERWIRSTDSDPHAGALALRSR